MKVLRTGLAAALVVCVCSMGMIVTTATPAAAFIDGGKLVKEGKQVGHAVGKGATLVGKFTPIGRIISAGSAVWWAYDNQDAVIDFLQGDGGTRSTYNDWKRETDPDYEPSTVVGTNQTGWSDGHLVISTLGMTSTNRPQFFIVSGPNNAYRTIPQVSDFGRVTIGGDPANNIDPTKHDVSSCRKPDGTIYMRDLQASGAGSPSPLSAIVGGPYPASVTTQTGGNWCNATADTLIGWQAWPKKTKLETTYLRGHGQTYPMGWGTLGDYDPLMDAPLRWTEAEVTARCKNAVTGATETIKTTSTYGDSGTVVLPSCKQWLGDDWYGTGFTIAPTKPEIDTDPDPDQETWEPLPEEWEVPDTLPTEWDELIPDEEDADWQPCHGTKKGCTLDVEVDGDICEVGMDKCKTWTKTRTISPNRVRCMYGSIAVDMKNCEVLAKFYQGTPQRTDTDEHTTPGTGTNTGTQSPGQATDSPPQTRGGPEEQAEANSCFPTGWGLLNPFEWVYKPVKCVFVWAFKPKTALSVRLDRLQTAIENKAPFSWFADIASMPSAVGGGGCPTHWVWTQGGTTTSIICGTTMGNGLRGFRPVLTFLVLGAAVVPFFRSFVYATTPLIKPVPSE